MKMLSVIVPCFNESANIDNTFKRIELNIKKIRPSNGLHPKYYFKILGRKMNKNISAGTALKIGHIKF